MTPPNHERMSSVDTAWLRMDSSSNAMMIVGVMVTETRLGLDEFRRMVESRFLCFPRFRLRPVADPLGASWVEAEDFELNAHVLRVKLPAPAGRTELQALAADLAGRPLNPDRPMWQLHLVEDYQGGSAFIMRIHHCYADGIAMVRVLLSMTEQDAGPAMAGGAARGKRKQKQQSGPRHGADILPLLNWVEQLSRPANDILESALAEGARLLEGGVHKLFHPDQAALVARQVGGLAAEFARVLALPDDPITPLRGEMTGMKRVAWAAPLELAEVKTVGRALDCTVNDVLMATMAGALGAYLREQHFDTGSLTIRASVPVNLRAAEEPLTLGNKFGLVFVDLPVGVRNPLQRVYAMHDTMRALKGSLQPPMTLMTLGLMGLLPAAVQAPAIEMFSRKGTVVASNVPGPQSPLFICGQRISEMYFWVPQSGSMGVGVSILSYAGKVFFGVIADEALLPDPQSVADRFAPEFERLLLAATMGALGSATSPLPKEAVGATAAGRRSTPNRRARVRKAASPPPPPARGRGSRKRK